MGFNLKGLEQAVACHGRVVRVVIATVQGSSPRDVGAAMLVWKDGQSGTIGGGALEYQAAGAARAMSGKARLTQHSLGPDLGQCCGGAVQLLAEVYDAEAVRMLANTEVVARPVGPQTEMPLAVKRVLATARAQGRAPIAQLLQGWMIEPIAKPERALWIWGAGHVGRAFVDVMAPLPELAITWVDTGLERFPADIPANVAVLPAVNPLDLVRHAPVDAQHLIVTYSHALDLELCHALLGHGFGFTGLIGSKSKWARFRGRLRALGHSEGQIARITCPIGDPELGKHPTAIAIGVATELLRPALISRKKEIPA